MKKIIFFTVLVLAIMSMGLVTNLNYESGDTSLASLISQASAQGESFGYYEGLFKIDKTHKVTGYVELGAGGEILSFAEVHFEGSVEYEATFEYSCCNSGGGMCSKEYPKCADISAWDLVMG